MFDYTRIVSNLILNMELDIQDINVSIIHPPEHECQPTSLKLDSLTKSIQVSNQSTQIQQLVITNLTLSQPDAFSLEIPEINIYHAESDGTIKDSMSRSVYYSGYVEDKFSLPQITQIIDQQLTLHTRALIIHSTSEIILHISPKITKTIESLLDCFTEITTPSQTNVSSTYINTNIPLFKFIIKDSANELLTVNLNEIEFTLDSEMSTAHIRYIILNDLTFGNDSSPIFCVSFDEDGLSIDFGDVQVGIQDSIYERLMSVGQDWFKIIQRSKILEYLQTNQNETKNSKVRLLFYY